MLRMAVLSILLEQGCFCSSTQVLLFWSIIQLVCVIVVSHNAGVTRVRKCIAKPAPLSSAEFQELISLLKQDGAQGLVSLRTHLGKHLTCPHSLTAFSCQNWLATAQLAVSCRLVYTLIYNTLTLIVSKT